MPPTINRIGHGLGVILLAAVAVLGILAAAPGLVGAETSMVVQSNSMTPTMQSGDLILTKHADPATIDTGDIITFESQRPGESGYITHRVTDIRSHDGQYQFETQGDANDRPDPNPVPGAAIVGDVWVVIPYVGHLIAFASSDLGIITFVILPFSGLVIVESISLWRDATAHHQPTTSSK